MKTFIVMAAMLGTIATVPAEARIQVRQDKTVRIAYAPSELLTAEGRARLQRRIASASYRVCRYDPMTGMILPTADELDCRRIALANARKDAERAILAANQGAMVASANR
ncbi:UrcA family protein [uncultured Sphingomonas sp.]|uniref:UrcA family protein n=1 Tax=uncultured Sphingomonas sp. TaxID=158754 RepID=UPI0025E7DEB1|nr:UrcA family protein [uncultured Sphingomonas sp.]